MTGKSANWPGNQPTDREISQLTGKSANWPGNQSNDRKSVNWPRFVDEGDGLRRAGLLTDAAEAAEPADDSDAVFDGRDAERTVGGTFAAADAFFRIDLHVSHRLCFSLCDILFFVICDFSDVFFIIS